METKHSTNRNRTIFRVIFLVFLAIVIYFLYDLSRQTVAPWNKKKNIEKEF
ncbi:hypothetical protein [Emticicia aquatica]|uniref:hypothetical protein n=1 Tax=Emticicia aquatica TaxID=1681835 RepID=UPI001EEB8356|nr:hypothetical protein [Emticicia aquatica]